MSTEGALIFLPLAKSWRSEGIIVGDKLCEKRDRGTGGEEANFSRQLFPLEWNSPLPSTPLVKYRETHRVAGFTSAFFFPSPSNQAKWALILSIDPIFSRGGREGVGSSPEFSKHQSWIIFISLLKKRDFI